jgi:hypothetical protein
LASRRRRRKTIGKVVSDVERRVRVVEKRPGAKRIKRNVVTAEKIQYRAIVAKNVATDAITPTEVSFGTTTVSATEPTENLKDGTTWVDPTTGAAKVYDTDAGDFVDLSAVDLTARASADGKNTIYRQNSQPTGGTYVTGDTWFDEDDGNKLYRYNGTTWVAFTLGNSAIASISATKILAGSLDASVIVTSNLDAGQITTGGMSAARITTGTLDAITINATNGGKIGAWKIGAATVTGASTYQALTSSVIAAGDDASKLEISYTIDTSDYAITGRNSYLLYLSNSYSSITFGTDSVTNSTISGRITLDTSGTTLTMGYDGQGYGNVITLTADTVDVAGDLTVSGTVTGTFSITSTSYSTNGLKNISATTSTGTPTGGDDGDIVLVYTA